MKAYKYVGGSKITSNSYWSIDLSTQRPGVKTQMAFYKRANKKIAVIVARAHVELHGIIR